MLTHVITIAARTHFVAPHGSDSADASFSRPLSTLAECVVGSKILATSADFNPAPIPSPPSWCHLLLAHRRHRL